MPRGVKVNWTRELLERARDAVGAAEVDALAAECNVASGSIYSLKVRIRDEGIDGILHKQEHRNESYHRGGGRSSPETVEEQLGRIYSITTAGAGRGGTHGQYTVTLPRSVAVVWVEKWGRQIRFVPTEEGLLIVPVKPVPPTAVPSWLGDVEDGPA